jgi:hypothetical protein
VMVSSVSDSGSSDRIARRACLGHRSRFRLSWMSGFLDWFRKQLAAILDFFRPRCLVAWRPNALAPVFYGTGDVGPADGSPATARIYFPSLDGSPDSAAVLTDCGRYPLVVFAHGHCPNDTDHYLKWIELPAQLARGGYVVAVPQLPEIQAGISPSDADADLAILRDLVIWMRSGWVHRSILAPAPATGLVGHSFGAGLAGRLATEGNARAFASLSGHVARPIREAIDVPKLFTWGFPTSDGAEQLLSISADEWADLGVPKHRIVFTELAHWDYLPSGRTACGQVRGDCPHSGVVAWDLVTTFFGNYLPPPAVPDLPGRIPPSLIPPQPDLTQEQKFFAGGWLSGFGLLEGSGDSCAVTISYETSIGSGTVVKPDAS